MKYRTGLPLLAALLIAAPAHAIILYGAGNSSNLTNPGTGVPFDSVGLISNFGSGVTGSAVYLGNGYMLTANHVTPSSSVTFDGSTFYTWDNTYTPVQIGTTDMKVFRLTTTPTVAAVLLFGGNPLFATETTVPAVMVGWGVGRDGTAINSNVVGWGDASTIAKRWGVNQPVGYGTINQDGYNYLAIETVLGSSTGTPPGVGSNEAAATLYDSGSGLFQNIGGTWYLTGLTTGVTTNGSSTFGDDADSSSADANFFVRITNNRAAIQALIPEPGSTLLIVLSGAGLFLRRRRA